MGDDFYCEEALSGRTPVDVVAETADVLAFHHTRPFWPVHIVVIPKMHVPSLTNLGSADDSVLHKVLAVVREIARRVEVEHGACRVLTNLGRYQDQAPALSCQLGRPVALRGPSRGDDRGDGSARLAALARGGRRGAAAPLRGTRHWMNPDVPVVWYAIDRAVWTAQKA